jgi:hypothetical protein
MTLPVSDVNQLANVLAGQAFVADHPARYLRELVLGANLPENWRREVAGQDFSDVDVGARRIIRWADAKGVNTCDTRYMALGTIVAPVLDSVGPDVAADIVAVIVARRLFTDRALLADVSEKYQVSISSATLASTFPVPVLEIANGEAELQASRVRAPDLLNVGFLAAAVRHSASVCRVEARTGQSFGAGFLVAPDLAVTSEHVVEKAGSAGLQLRFRCTTDAAGVLLQLDGTQPIARYSPPFKLDYALLRLSHRVDPVQGLAVVDIRGAPEPQPGDTLSILQHPDDGPMKLAVTTNGVVRTYPERSTVRYQTMTAGGSSGAPCFDEEWRLVAVHRAERAIVTGAVREGVLMRSIYREISSLL